MSVARARPSPLPPIFPQIDPPPVGIPVTPFPALLDHLQALPRSQLDVGQPTQFESPTTAPFPFSKNAAAAPHSRFLLACLPGSAGSGRDSGSSDPRQRA